LILLPPTFRAETLSREGIAMFSLQHKLSERNTMSRYTTLSILFVVYCI
jgi:hypothetical protein